VDIELHSQHDRVGNVHEFVVLFRAMSTNPVDNVHDFVVLFCAISTIFWFSSMLSKSEMNKTDNWSKNTL